MNTKHQQLMTILSKAGIDEDTRHDLVSAWTAGRTASTTELTTEEMDNLIWKLNNDFLFRHNPKHAISILEEAELKRKRSVVLAIAQRTGLHTGTDFVRFNGWMKKCSVHKKMLNKYNSDELYELLKQMRALERNYNNSAETPGTKAWEHANGLPGNSSC